MSISRITAFVVALALPLCLPAQDQKLSPTAADEMAAQQATLTHMIAARAQTDAGRNARKSDLIIGSAQSGDNQGHGAGPTLFPADLSKVNPTGLTLSTTTLHNLYLNRPPSAWGDPVRFLNDMNESEFIHITDQYVGVEFPGRYPLGTSFRATLAPVAGFTSANTNIFSIDQIVVLLHAAGSVAGTGPGHVFNVFITPGDDLCFFDDQGNPVFCFSPDNPNTFAFCAFHSAVVFPDIGEVLFTVVPDTGVPGCASQQPSPNGIVADSVDSTLSHELFETITDPEGDGWQALSSLDEFGFEIGDVCQPAGKNHQFLVPTFNVHGHPYAIQLEYSNRGHGCFSRPVDQ